ncbi:MAG: hypothetical protein R3191_05505 [Anaerolineales bacterium]|nr:hypothetical protein [Anaerolineales bacterium]
MHLVVNAWPLCVEPQSMPAFHLLELLEELKEVEPGLQITLIGPQPTQLDRPAGSEFISADLPVGEWGRLRFEQRALPRLAGKNEGDVLLSLTDSAPLRSPMPVIALTVRDSASDSDGFLFRLRRAIGQAGLAGAAARWRWSDEPLSEGDSTTQVLPTVSPRFRATDPGDDREVRSELNLPLGYVLCLGAELLDLPVLLAAWTWVDASVGDAYPLTFVGLSEAGRHYVGERSTELNVRESVLVLEEVGFEQLPAIYRGADAFLHPGYSLTGQELRWALATGVPIACAETPYASSLLGEAAYLAPSDNTRSLGASCLTLLVEHQEVAKPLREKGLMRAAEYHGQEPRSGLMRLIRSVINQTSNGRK